MDIINKNPYRYLGVYSNSPTKERVANKGKMNAFLKVGKFVSFPLDLPQLLSPIDRNVDSVTDAESRLTLPIDQIRYALFWWMKASPLDEIAFNHLFNGNVDMAKSIWMKKGNVPSLQNRIVLALAQNDIALAIQCAQELYRYDNLSEEFIQYVVGEGYQSDVSLWQMFFDSLLDAGISTQTISDNISINEWKTYVNQKIITPLFDTISSAIATSKASKGKGPNARLKAGQKLMTETRNTLDQLKNVLPATDIRYQTIADKLAGEILQCGIDYFNNTEDDDAPKKAMDLQSYALSIAVSKMARDRCKENVDVLKKIGKEYSVRRELNALTSTIKELRGETEEPEEKETEKDDNAFRLHVHTIQFKPYDAASRAMIYGFQPDSLLEASCDVIDAIGQAVIDSIPLLNTMKSKLGGSDQLYLVISSALAGAAVNALVGNVNIVTRMGHLNESRRNSGIQAAVNVMSRIGQLDMDSKTRNYYNGNNSTLGNINSKVNGGCYIATMVYGDYDHPQVMVLRGFRDNYLAERGWGREFIKQYYKYSPRLVEKLKDCKWINLAIRKVLDKFVEHLKRNI